MTSSFNLLPRVLKGAEYNPLTKDLKCQVCCHPLFLRQCLLVNVQCDSAIRMTEQFLGCFDVHPFLPQYGRQSMPEAVPTDLLLYPNPLQCWPNMTLENHVRLDWLGAILLNGREEVIVIGVV